MRVRFEEDERFVIAMFKKNCRTETMQEIRRILPFVKEDTEMLTDYYLNDCMECGCCSFVCPGKLPLTETFVQAKHMLKGGK